MSSAYPKSRTFGCLMLCQKASGQDAVRDHGQESWSKLTKKNIPHHRMSCPLYKMGKLTRMGQFLCRDWMGIGQWLVNYCILHQLSLGFYFSRSCFHFSLLFNFLINQLLVCQPMVFTFFLVLPMSLWWCVGSKWTSVDGHTAVLLMQYYFAYFKSYWI